MRGIYFWRSRMQGELRNELLEVMESTGVVIQKAMAPATITHVIAADLADKSSQKLTIARQQQCATLPVPRCLRAKVQSNIVTSTCILVHSAVLGANTQVHELECSARVSYFMGMSLQLVCGATDARAGHVLTVHRSRREIFLVNCLWLLNSVRHWQRQSEGERTSHISFAARFPAHTACATLPCLPCMRASI